MSTPHLIQTRDLTRFYGPTVGVEGLDLEIGAGEVFGFLGPNGARKTTTIRLLLDLIRLWVAKTPSGAKLLPFPRLSESER